MILHFKILTYYLKKGRNLKMTLYTKILTCLKKGTSLEVFFLKIFTFF